MNNKTIWIGILVAAFVGYMIYRHKMGASAAPTSTGG